MIVAVAVTGASKVSISCAFRITDHDRSLGFSPYAVRRAPYAEFYFFSAKSITCCITLMALPPQILATCSSL